MNEASSLGVTVLYLQYVFVQRNIQASSGDAGKEYWGTGAVLMKVEMEQKTSDKTPPMPPIPLSPPPTD